MAGARASAGRRVIHRVKIMGDLDRRAAEALELEVRRLAKRCGLDLEEVRIEQVKEETRDLSARGENSDRARRVNGVSIARRACDGPR